ncbi:MAG: protein kinase [Proteobacteria bacterium]|nr:protein kinase [Pseudomonadota bacterium]
MGKVFKIEYPVTGKIAALKLLDPNPFLLSLLGKEDIEEMFTREAVTMAGIRHPNIVDILDFDRFDGKLYYIMSFYCNNLGLMIGEGYETDHESRIVPVERALFYSIQTLKGLSRLHEDGIIHRDIKPFNLLVTDFDTVKICDFGLSKLRGEIRKDPESLKIGSPHYAAPEQEKDPDSADARSDLYSAGVMLYRMLTGRLPMKPVASPSQFNPDLDKDWDDWFLRAVRRKPEERYASAGAFVEALETVKGMWLQKKERICSAPSLLFGEHDTVKAPFAIRSKPEKISRDKASETFHVDHLMRPFHFMDNSFIRLSPDVIFDEATNLLWQVSGTRFPVNWENAHQYIGRLNRDAFHGYKSWRMPTINELLSILSPLPKGEGHCADPIFDQTQKWLWSCDRCTFISAWYMSLDLGFISFNDRSSYYYVKGVCSKP